MWIPLLPRLCLAPTKAAYPLQRPRLLRQPQQPVPIARSSAYRCAIRRRLRAKSQSFETLAARNIPFIKPSWQQVRQRSGRRGLAGRCTTRRADPSRAPRATQTSRYSIRQARLPGRNRPVLPRVLCTCTALARVEVVVREPRSLPSSSVAVALVVGVARTSMSFSALRICPPQNK